MPHIDELMGVATVAAAGLLAAILLQPALYAAGDAAVGPSVPALTIEVAAGRNMERQPGVARECAAIEAGRPDA
jgi:hypothetical protein